MISNQDYNTSSKLILGTVQLGLPYGINNSSGKPTLDEGLSILKEASSRGIRTLDTAEAYGDSLDVISVGLKQGLKFEILTKIKPQDGHIPQYVEALLKRMGINSFYAISLHSAWSNYSSKQLKDIGELKKNGLIKNFGVSLYTNDECLEAARRPEIDIVQVPYNLLDGWHVRGEILKILKDQKKIVHVRSVFLQGMFFKDSVRGDLQYPLIELKKMSKHWVGGISQMAIDYVRGNPFIDGVLLGAETRDQIIKNCEMWSNKLEKVPYTGFISLNSKAKQELDPRTWE